MISDLAVMQEEVQKKIDKKKKAIEYYSKFLGLEFRKIKGNF